MNKDSNFSIEPPLKKRRLLLTKEEEQQLRMYIHCFISYRTMR